jgi:hypothetical protein
MTKKITVACQQAKKNKKRGETRGRKKKIPSNRGKHLGALKSLCSIARVPTKKENN